MLCKWWTLYCKIVCDMYTLSHDVFDSHVALLLDNQKYLRVQMMSIQKSQDFVLSLQSQVECRWLPNGEEILIHYKYLGVQRMSIQKSEKFPSFRLCKAADWSLS